MRDIQISLLNISGVNLMKESVEKLKNAIIEIDDGAISGLIEECLDDGLSPMEIIDGVLREALDVVGEKFESGEYFLADLIMAGEMVTEATNILKEKMDPGELGKKGKIIIATVQGDIHDIGKNIVGMVLSASGYSVVDLGVDVPSSEIVGAVKESQASMLGLSVLLTTMTHRISEIVELLDKEGLREKVKVGIGGACCSHKLAEEMGADGFSESAVSAVRLFDDFRQNLVST